MAFWNAVVASPSKSFAAGAIAFCVGVAGGLLFVTGAQAANLLGALGVALAVCAGATVLVSQKSWRMAGLCVVLLLAGLYRTTQDLIPPLLTAADFAGHEHRISGVVAAEPGAGPTARITLNELSIDYAGVSGRFQTWVSTATPIAFGDRVAFTCGIELPQPFDGFDYPAYLRAHDVYAICYRPSQVVVEPPASPSITARLLAIKASLVDRLTRILPEPFASFIAGLIFGGDAGLSDALQNDFARTGTSHILAASGSNVSLFSAVLFAWLASAFGRRRASVLSIALVVCYVVVAGGTAAVVRAGIMAALVLVGAFIRRKPSSVNLFLAAGAGMLFFRPLLLADVGFQLSFVAMIAIGFLAPRWQPAFSFIPEMLGLRTSLVASLAAALLSTPILLWHFGTISLISPISNFLILPLVPWIMAVALIALVVSAFSFQLATLVAIPAWGMSSVLLHIVSWQSALSFATISTPSAHLLSLLSLLPLLSLLLWHLRTREKTKDAA